MELLSDLVAIESVNPSMPGSAAGEAEIARYIAEFCRRQGLEVDVHEVLPDRPNVVARLAVPEPEGTLLFEGHTDTVTLANMSDGLKPRIETRRLHGRGACDAKGGIASALHMFELLADEDLPPRVDVVFLAAVDEESTYQGVLDFLGRGFHVDGAVVIEPTDLAPVLAHKGCVRGRIAVQGRSAHTSRPELGRNAIEQMVKVVAALDDWAEDRFRSRQHPLCGPPTFCVSRIEGGLQVNIVPARCSIEFDCRILPDENPVEVLGSIEHLLDSMSKGADGIRVELEAVLLSDWGLDTSEDAAIAKATQEACAAVRTRSGFVGAPYGSDASKLSVRGGIPSLVLGPGDIAQAHSDDEWVEMDQVVAAAEIYTLIARDFSPAKS